MAIIKFRAEIPEHEFGVETPVPAPLGEPVSRTRVRSWSSETTASTRTGVWTCSPGRWVRQIASAEFCHFLDGECIFKPDVGEPIRIVAGDCLYFPANSRGVWDVITPCTKVFVVFSEI